MLGIFLDTETTGLDNNPDSAILSIAVKIVDLETLKVKGSFESNVLQDISVWSKAHPKALACNGMSFEKDGDKGQSIEIVKDKLLTFLATNKARLGTAVFICQNPSFDKHFFKMMVSEKEMFQYKLPYHWLDLASMFLFSKAKAKEIDTIKSFSKDAIAISLGLEKEASIHEAMGGVDHLLECYAALIKEPIEEDFYHV